MSPRVIPESGEISLRGLPSREVLRLDILSMFLLSKVKVDFKLAIAAKDIETISPMVDKASFRVTYFPKAFFKKAFKPLGF